MIMTGLFYANLASRNYSLAHFFAAVLLFPLGVGGWVDLVCDVC